MGVSPNINWNLFINSLIRDIKTEKKIEIYNPNHYRPFLNIKDAEIYLNWLISEEGKFLINNYKINDQQLFYFNYDK